MATTTAATLPRLAVATVALLLGSSASPLAESLPPLLLREANVFSSLGSHVGEFSLPTASEILEFRILNSGRSIALLRGPGSNHVAFPGEEPYLGGGSLRPGLHRLYLVSEGHVPAQALLKLRNVTGEAAFQLPQSVGGHVGELPPAFSLGVEGGGVQRFADRKTFDRAPYTGFYIEETYGAGVVAHYSGAWRWSMEGGVGYCLGSLGGGVFGSATVQSFMGINLGPSVELAYYREVAGTVPTSKVMGYWIERAEGDPPTTPLVTPVPSPTHGHKLLDQDPACQMTKAAREVEEAHALVKGALPEAAIRRTASPPAVQFGTHPGGKG